MMLCSLFFGAEKTSMNVDRAFVFPLSYGLLFGSWLIYYLVKVYEKRGRPDFASVQRADEEEFTEEVGRRRKDT